MSYKKIWEQDKNHVLHPWMDFSEFKKLGCDIMVKGDGVYIEDAKGNRYIDGIGGLWCVNIGFNNQRMKDAIARQLDELCYYSPFNNVTTPPAARLGAKLAEIAPKNINHSFFSTSGSMANDSAVRIAHLYNYNLGRPEKRKIISRYNSYHGSGFLASALTGIAFNHVGWHLPKDLIEYISEANVYRPPQPGMSEEEHCEYLVNEFEGKILELGPETVAAFIAEPIVGAGGILVAPKGYHARMKKVCEKYELLYISDEVVTAFGRLGHFFASEDIFNVTPDILTTAKGITSGYIPLGATMISDKIYDAISVPQMEGGLFTQGFTYTGHPVSCAAALENIKIIEEDNILEHVQKMGKYFEKSVKALEKISIVGNVRGSHFMIGIEPVADKETKVLFPADLQIGKMIANEARQRGLIVRRSRHICMLSPALILTKEQIDRIVSILEESLTAVSDKVKDYIQ